jgi:thioredoxin 1
METKTLPALKSVDFEKEVLKASTPAVVDFYADWCGPCRMVSPIIEQLSKEYAGKVKFAKVNTDENPDIAMKYGIMSIPTIIVFKNGQVASTVIGAGPASMYKQKIDAVLKG